MEDRNPSNPADPDPRNQGDSGERTGLWKPGDGGFDSHLPDKRSLDDVYEIVKHNFLFYSGK